MALTLLAQSSSLLALDARAVTVVGILLCGLIAVTWGKFVVPRYSYDRELNRADNAEIQSEKRRETLEGMVRAYERLATEALAAERDITSGLKNLEIQQMQQNVHLIDLKHSLEILRTQVLAEDSRKES